MRLFVCGAALSAALIGGVVYATSANASGLTGLHKQVQIGDRICMVDHDHYGDSGAWATKQQAVAAAAWSWGSFTALEYGREWGEFRLAQNQDMQCGPVASDRGGQLWNCKSKATPCKPAHPVTIAAPVQHLPPVSVVASPIIASRVAASPHSHVARRLVRAPLQAVRNAVRHHANAAGGHPHHPHSRLVWPGDAR